MRLARFELALAFLVMLAGALYAFFAQRATIALLALTLSAGIALYWAILAQRRDPSRR